MDKYIWSYYTKLKNEGCWFQGPILILNICFYIKFLIKTDSAAVLKNILFPTKRNEKVLVYFSATDTQKILHEFR